jgi:hypothetical protein
MRESSGLLVSSINKINQAAGIIKSFLELLLVCVITVDTASSLIAAISWATRSKFGITLRSPFYAKKEKKTIRLIYAQRTIIGGMEKKTQERAGSMVVESA